MNKTITFLAAALILSGCHESSGSSRSSSLTDQEILAKLDERLSPAPKAPRELHFIVRRRLNGQDIACGYSGFPPVRGTFGEVMPAGYDTVFLVRGRQLFLQQDVGNSEFDRWQDSLCGPDWFKPLPVGPVVR